MKKIIFILILFLSCYFIYNLTKDNKINYLTIGDSISSGQSSYGVKRYGYSFYVKDYLKDLNKLKSFNDSFTSSDYRITDLLRIIEYNEIKNINGIEISLNQLIKKADVITLSIGMNELYYKLKMNNENIYNYMNELIYDMEELLHHINKFNHKKVIIIKNI